MDLHHMPTRSKSILRPPKIPKTDKRLIGTWKSDAKRTLREWLWKKEPSEDRVRFVKFIFGKSEITYSRNTVTLNYTGEWASSRHFAVLGVDKDSVAIIHYGQADIKNRQKYLPESLEILDELYATPKILHIHFEKNYFWISLAGGRNREFFRKMRNAK